ncbi:MAG: DNA (cytosine-5-)-methyltransferase [Fimbriimonadales bacterium]|nr:DNA (cytosine-5-)-methyltransferase [Fimbriimonadales bacterium]
MPQSPQPSLPFAAWVADPSPAPFRFIDLFAGIGGFRLALESLGGKCVFTCEIDSSCIKTYAANFNLNHPVMGDIRSVPAEAVPDHDLLVAGFPCQPFSIAGVSKKNSLGKPHGFECATQGTLFFDIARILEAKKPHAFLLENVKNLRSHDRGKTFRIIHDTLTKELGYFVQWNVIDAQGWVPQHRERIFIVGFRADVHVGLDSILPEQPKPRLRDILHRTDGSEPRLEHDGCRFFDHRLGRVNSKYELSDRLWSYLQSYAEKHRQAGNGFGYGLVDRDSVARTLSARYYKDGSEILVKDEAFRNPRRLTPRECARLMGFPDSFRIPVSDSHAYKQFGNSVAVPVVRAVARNLLPLLGKSDPESEL